MPCFNNTVSFFSQLISLLYILIGLLCIGYGLYVVFLPWGGVDREFYLALGVCITLFGSSLVCISAFGLDAAKHQIKRFGKGWSGRSAIACYSIYLVCVLGAIILGYIYGHQWLDKVHSAIQDLEADSSVEPSYSNLESKIKIHFDILYFNVARNCDNKLAWFWAYVQYNCPEVMQREHCEGCESYSVTFCALDDQACYAPAGDAASGLNDACPYHTCREGTLRFIYDTAKLCFDPIIFGLGGLVLFHIICNFFLIVHVQMKKMAIIVIESDSGDADADLLPDNNAAEHDSNKSGIELNYQIYGSHEGANSVPSHQHVNGTVAAPPQTLTLQPAGQNRPVSTRRVDTENATIDSFIQMSFASSSVKAGSEERSGASFEAYSLTEAHTQATLRVQSQEATAYSTYQLNMEIALAESLEGKDKAAHERQSTSDKDLEKALLESQLDDLGI